MRVFIAGMDGYLGWPLAQYLASRSHEVSGADALLRRSWVEELDAVSAIPIASLDERLHALRAETGQAIPFWRGDLQDYALVERIFLEFEPEAIIHLGECSSDPYSVIDRKHTVFAQVNNLTTTFIAVCRRDSLPRASGKARDLPGFNPLNADMREGGAHWSMGNAKTPCHSRHRLRTALCTRAGSGEFVPRRSDKAWSSVLAPRARVMIRGCAPGLTLTGLSEP